LTKTTLTNTHLVTRYQDGPHNCNRNGESGRQWLVDHQQPGGSWRGLGELRIAAYYKDSWALAASGQFSAAHRLLDYVNSTFLQGNGDLTGRKHPSFEVGCPLYPNAYVIVGATVCGRYDIAAPATRFLLSRQDPGTGGFFVRRPEAGRCGTNTFSTGPRDSRVSLPADLMQPGAPVTT
jgi:hypothetical protein